MLQQQNYGQLATVYACEVLHFKRVLIVISDFPAVPNTCRTKDCVNSFTF